MKAISDRSWLSLLYHRIHTSSTYETDFHPILVFISQRNPYVYGFNRKNEIRMLAIDRILEIRDVHEGPHPRCDMKLLQDLLSDPFGITCEAEPYEAKILIAPNQAPYEKEKQWPKGKVSFTETEDGTVMTATTRTVADIERYILKWTPSMKVLKPEWLAEKIKAALRKGMQQYD